VCYIYFGQNICDSRATCWNSFSGFNSTYSILCSFFYRCRDMKGQLYVMPRVVTVKRQKNELKSLLILTVVTE